ncbi:response regulator [Pseudobacteriovorax antillogorgiicola]|uniref:Response regulator receiver domain-containing protein n=1 Tax=Pseudobacteriovorax antillogorgiicola TaxID=1513793 RepID=A0A1Y6CGK7_9BACT|nr:response regulator [Pseudobacteriovorax antillogorgiicola]TCS48734.1 response regulator receiver domain-containing protein [Pseudobacteriovorax antillogorgiicola]SMF54402.1 Response regulator receiver domain-containing protein [Pseudobacteriovorax antillogorgiicola]
MVKRAAIVDDETSIADTLAFVLDHLGIPISIETFNRLDVFHVSQDSLPFDILLLDLNLPGLGSHKISEFLDSLDSQTKIVIMTGDHTFACPSSRIEEVIHKPFDIPNLERLIRSAIADD